MPRAYVRKTNKLGWSTEDLENALNAIRKSKMKIREAGRKYSIPESTLRGKLKLDEDVEVREQRLGRKPILTKEMECELATYLIEMSKLYFGLTPIDLRKLAFSFATQNNIKNNFNCDRKTAGMDWYRSFLKRNPRISLRRPEPTSLNRITAFNTEEIKIFYDNLKILMDKKQFPARRIFNVDETGITTVQKPPPVLAEKGVKQLGSATSAERGRTTTVVCAFSATGIYIPPMFIFARQRMTPLLQKDGPAGAIYKCSKNGWINEELFLEWLQHFTAHTSPCKDDPVLLVLDNHSSHISLASYNFCRKNFIEVLTIPPHSSHRLQPLDVAFYGPLKNAYNNQCSAFMRNNPLQTISTYEIAAIFNSAYIKSATMDKAMSGFSCSGIYPYNTNILNELIEQSENQNKTKVTTLTLPNLISDKTTNKRKQHSIIMTCTPMKEELEKQQAKKELKTPSVIEKGHIDRVKKNMSFECSDNSTKLGVSKISSGSKTIQAHLEVSNEPKQTKKGFKTQRVIKKPNLKVSHELKKAKTEFNTSVIKKACISSAKRNVSFENPDNCSNLDVAELAAVSETSREHLSNGVLLATASGAKSCLYCAEFGSISEKRLKCIYCSGWVHLFCSGCDDTPSMQKGFICDFCLDD